MLIGLLALPFGLLCLWPLVRRRLFPERAHAGVALLVGFALSAGGLTLWMLLVGLLPGRPLNFWTAALFPALAWAIGLADVISNLTPALAGGARELQTPNVQLQTSNLRLSLSKYRILGVVARPLTARTWLLLAIIGSLFVSLAHSLYYPFVGEDELSRYAYYARLVFESGRIAPAVSGYPLLLPLGYAWAFFASAGLNEHVAKIVSWAFAPATVAATYWLAALWGGKRAGLTAAFTLAVTRLFVDWSPMGYVDIPTGLYFALAGVALTLWLQRQEARFAALAGAMMGLALWTKQAGFAVLPSAALIFLWSLTRRRTDNPDHRRSSVGARRSSPAVRLRSFLTGHWSLVIGHWSLAFALAAMIALPWYGRNAALGGWGNAVPGPGEFYYQQARRSAVDLIPFAGWAGDFGYGVAPLYMAGMVGGAALLLDARRRAGALVQWAFILPYLALWWNWFSYDARFLLTILPFYAALVGLSGDWLAARVVARSGPHPAFVAGLAGVLLIGGVYSRAGGVYRLLAAPFASDAEKLLQYKPDVASTVAFLRRTAAPRQDRIFSMDSRITYYLTDYDLTVGYPTQLEQLQGYRYFVAGSWAFSDVYPRLGQAHNEVVRQLEDLQAFELLYTSELGTVKVYRVLTGGEGGLTVIARAP